MGSPFVRKSFIYLRHGETDWNREHRCVGQVDRPLTELGRKQAEIARSFFISLTEATIFHSPLIRAKETASIIARGMPYPLICETDLKEVCLGDKEGCVEIDPADDFISTWFAGTKIPNAEPYEVFRDRVLNGINRCLSRKTGGMPIIVAHSAVFSALSDIAGHGISDIEHCKPKMFRCSLRGWTVEDAI